MPLKQLIKQCRKLRIHTVADVDDLVFIPEFSKISPSVINKQATEARVQIRFADNLRAMNLFDEITVATAPLALHWRKHTGKDNVTIIPNGLSHRWLQVEVAHNAANDDATKVITYLPGSNSHDKDFSEIAEVISDTLYEHANTRLLIVGTLNTDGSSFPENRVNRCSWLDYFRLPQLISYSSVTLAPLVASPFTYAKSHIKYIESAAFGTPAICSPNHDICRHNSKGLLLATSANDWYSALNQFLTNPPDAHSINEMKTRVRETASADHSASILASCWAKSGIRPLSKAA
jgi:glycosyltransferase involved in cell wall biosynthesis